MRLDASTAPCSAAKSVNSASSVSYNKPYRNSCKFPNRSICSNRSKRDYFDRVLVAPQLYLRLPGRGVDNTCSLTVGVNKR